MSDEHAMITSHNCADCIHNSVCNYKQDYRDICNAVCEANVYKQTDRNKVKVSNVMNYSDILGEIIVKCKHYHSGETIRVDSNGFTIKSFPHINYCDSVNTNHTTATDPRVWAGVYADGEN